jgi:hypothetical protein
MPAASLAFPVTLEAIPARTRSAAADSRMEPALAGLYCVGAAPCAERRTGALLLLEGAGALLAQVMADGVGERSAWDHRKGEMLECKAKGEGP